MTFSAWKASSPESTSCNFKTRESMRHYNCLYKLTTFKQLLAGKRHLHVIISKIIKDLQRKPEFYSEKEVLSMHTITLYTLYVNGYAD